MTANDRYAIPPSSTSNAYRPSVPLAIYRELAQEAQATQARLETLEKQNQRLVQENKQLRQEIDQIIQLAQKLQQTVATSELVEPSSVSSSKTAKPAQQKISKRGAPPVAEISARQSHYRTVAKSNSEINGWVLAIALCLIVLTSCLGAFLIVSARLGQNK